MIASGNFKRDDLPDMAKINRKFFNRHLLHFGAITTHMPPGFDGFKRVTLVILVPSINHTASVQSSCWKSKSRWPS